jgi:hypothetical protein
MAHPSAVKPMTLSYPQGNPFDIRDIALAENDLILAVVRYRFPGPYLGEKDLGIEPVLCCFPHKTLLRSDEILEY